MSFLPHWAAVLWPQSDPTASSRFHSTAKKCILSIYILIIRDLNYKLNKKTSYYIKISPQHTLMASVWEDKLNSLTPRQCKMHLTSASVLAWLNHHRSLLYWSQTFLYSADIVRIFLKSQQMVTYLLTLCFGAAMGSEKAKKGRAKFMKPFL